MQYIFLMEQVTSQYRHSIKKGTSDWIIAHLNQSRHVFQRLCSDRNKSSEGSDWTHPVTRNSDWTIGERAHQFMKQVRVREDRGESLSH